jgi:hypothetical protein
VSGVRAAGDADGVIDADGVGTRIALVGTGVATLDEADGDAAEPVLQAAAATARTAASAMARTTGYDGCTGGWTSIDLE